MHLPANLHKLAKKAKPPKQNPTRPLGDKCFRARVLLLGFFSPIFLFVFQCKTKELRHPTTKGKVQETSFDQTE